MAENMSCASCSHLKYYPGHKKQLLWQRVTPERIDLDIRKPFQNNHTVTWATEHGIEWVYHIPCHVPVCEN